MADFSCAADDSAWRDIVIGVELHCRLALTNWLISDDALLTVPVEPSRKSLQHLGKAFAAASLAPEVVIKSRCRRLTLVARMLKLFRKLAVSSPQRRGLIRSALSWATSSLAASSKDNVVLPEDELSTIIDQGWVDGVASTADVADDKNAAMAAKAVLTTARQLEALWPDEEVARASSSSSVLAPAPAAAEVGVRARRVDVSVLTGDCRASYAAACPDVVMMASMPAAAFSTAPVGVESGPVRRMPPDNSVRSHPYGQDAAVVQAPAPSTSGVRHVRARAAAQGADIFGEDMPIERSRKREAWTADEEQRLIQGYKRYGTQWENIRTTCNLEHRNGVQLKDKVRNLCRARRL